MSKFTDWLAKSGPSSLGGVGKHHTLKKNRYIEEFTVTFDALDNPETKAPPELDPQLEGIFRLAQRDPAAALPKIESLLQQFPDERHLLNYLASTREATGDLEGAAEASERNYRLHPNYLFARMNHAEFLLKDGRLKDIPAVLGGHFSLRELYPHRNVFHISEVLTFYSFLGRYRATQGDLDEAESILEFLEDLAPDHYATIALDDFLDYITSRLPAKAARGRADAGSASQPSDAWSVHARPTPPPPRQNRKRKRRR
jgi:tetratricopeptide (TPR) repeat protein